MATTVRRQSHSGYRSYGNVAYAPDYDGNAVRMPAGEEAARPSVRPREHAIARPKVAVRPAGRVAPFAVVGFMAVALLAALLVYSNVQMAILTDQASTLKSELSALQTENDALTAEYEQTFDQAHLEQAVGGYMSKPNADQFIYIDLSDEDTVVVYDQEEEAGAFAGIIDGVKEIVGNVAEYFR